MGPRDRRCKLHATIKAARCALAWGTLHVSVLHGSIEGHGRLWILVRAEELLQGVRSREMRIVMRELEQLFHLGYGFGDLDQLDLVRKIERFTHL